MKEISRKFSLLIKIHLLRKFQNNLNGSFLINFKGMELKNIQVNEFIHLIPTVLFD